MQKINLGIGISTTHINPFCVNYAMHGYARILFRSKAEKRCFVTIHLIISDPLISLYFIMDKGSCFPVAPSSLSLSKALNFFPMLSY